MIDIVSTVAATGPQGRALALAARLVAHSDYFQRARNVTTAEEAWPHVHWPLLWVDLDAEPARRPCAVLESAELVWSRISGGAQNRLLPAGAIALGLTDRHDGARDPLALRDSFLRFCNLCDGVLSDLAELSGRDAELNLVGIDQIQPPLLAEPPHHYWTAWYLLRWGGAS